MKGEKNRTMEQNRGYKQTHTYTVITFTTKVLMQFSGKMVVFCTMNQMHIHMGKNDL